MTKTTPWRAGKIREKVSSKAAYFHLVSWSVPLVLTITCMALAQVRKRFIKDIVFPSRFSLARRWSACVTRRYRQKLSSNRFRAIKFLSIGDGQKARHQLLTLVGRFFLV